MELNPFKVKNKKKQVFIISSLLIIISLIVVVIIQSYALYEVQKEYDVIEGSVPTHMDNFDVKVALTIDGTPSTTFPEKGSNKTVDSIICDKGATATWDYEKWDIIVHNVKQTKTKCQVNFVTKYTDSVLNGNDPVLAENLIPVTIENQNGENIVKKASQKDAWYSYQDKQWANAVILKDENETYKAGEEIPEDKIESYFVWIPKFDYQIFNITDYPDLGTVTNKVETIKIRFNASSTTDTSSECKSPNKSGDIGTCTVGKWMTHPAFVDGFEGITGMWVGKFETSRDTSVSIKENEINSDAIQIRPNVSSWRIIQPAHAFYSTYHYKRELDSHMMKNTEWGAVAYLTQSQYGKTSQVRINNNSNYVTGYAGVHEPTIGYTGRSISCTTTPSACNEYGTDTNITKPWNDTTTLGMASTTGNVTGIYDMNGGAYEYVMGSMMNDKGMLTSGRHSTWNSNFIGALTYPNDDSNTNNRIKTEWTQEDGGVPYPENKYFNLYQYGPSDSGYNRRILGDATGEMGPFQDKTYDTQTRHVSSWNDNEAWFVFRNSPWFVRGSSWNNGTGAGMFAFGNADGVAAGIYSFRVVLSI